jgi:7-cyano-7-deazaguanine synthase
MNPRAIVLLSGGLDSATCLLIALREGFAAHALSFDYGQRHSIELERARALAARYGAAEHRIARIDLASPSSSSLTDASRPVPRRPRGDASIPSTYVPARNTLFLAHALAWAEPLGASDIFVGANAIDYSGYPDCRPAFLNAFERMANLATKAGVEGTIRTRIRAPLLRMTKGEIVRKAAKLGLDFSLTSSCYDPSRAGIPCGSCDSCRLREKGFREARLADPLRRSGRSGAKTRRRVALSGPNRDSPPGRRRA